MKTSTLSNTSTVRSKGPAITAPWRRLRREELPRATRKLARFLIGKILVHEGPWGRLSGRIVETEAYVPGDAASHAFRGITLRNQSLFLERGFAYVYFIYGNYFCVNVSSETTDVGAGVLLRAAEPMEGLEFMLQSKTGLGAIKVASGPGRLARAFRIDRRQDGVDLCGRGRLWLGDGNLKRGSVGRSVRIGITREAHRLLRFYERGNPHVSGPLRLRP